MVNARRAHVWETLKAVAGFGRRICVQMSQRQHLGVSREAFLYSNHPKLPFLSRKLLKYAKLYPTLNFTEYSTQNVSLSLDQGSRSCKVEVHHCCKAELAVPPGQDLLGRSK